VVGAIAVEEFVIVAFDGDDQAAEVIGGEDIAVGFEFVDLPIALEFGQVGRKGIGALGFHAEITELNGHGLAGVQLEREDAGHGALGFAIVGDIDGLTPIDEVLEMVALGDDDVIIPITLVNGGLDVGGISE
jgi:hypothetical protein